VEGIVHASIGEVADRPVSSVITVRGKELAATDTVAAARALFANSSVQVVPVLDGAMYTGAVAPEDIEGAGEDELISGYATARFPTARASTRTEDALATLAESEGRRLVVLGEDGSTYVGLVCLSRDHAGLCIDAECHTGGTR
jgi:predicted transcriptional regulator